MGESRGYVHREGEGCCSGMGIFHDASGQQRPLARSRGFTGSRKGDAPRCARPPVPLLKFSLKNYSFLSLFFFLL